MAEELLLTTAEAAARLGLKPHTLEVWRVYGGGPVFRKLRGRAVRYRPQDLEAFVEVAGRTNTGGGRPVQTGVGEC